MLVDTYWLAVKSRYLYKPHTEAIKRIPIAIESSIDKSGQLYNWAFFNTNHHQMTALYK